MLDLSTNLPFEDMPTKSEATNPWTVEKSWLGTEASHFSSISLTLIFFPLGAAAAVGAAGFVAVVVVASFFGAVGEVAGSAFFSAAGAVASAGFDAGVSSTVADAFSSVVGVVDSAGDADSSCAKVIVARKAVARNEMIIFMGFLLFGFDADYREPGCAQIVFGWSRAGQGLSRTESAAENRWTRLTGRTKT